MCCFKPPSVCVQPPATGNENTHSQRVATYSSQESSVYQQWCHCSPCHQSPGISPLLTSIPKVRETEETECIFIPPLFLANKLKNMSTREVYYIPLLSILAT